MGALIAVLLPRFPRLPYAFTLAGSVASIAVALVPRDDGVLRVSLGSVAPFAALNFRLDALSNYFLLMIGALVGAVSVYAFGYVDRRHYGGWAPGAAFYAFVAAMAGVVLADGVFSFLLFWELMSLASFVLVVHDHQIAEVRRAGFIYLAMAHAGAGFLIAAFLLLAGQAGSLDFAAFRNNAGSLPPLLRNAAFLLFLVGFAAKAGVIPLHIWLPRAHPAAPSHVSALMSGVMIKMGIYGMVRVFFEFLAPVEAWWGWLLLLLGASSAVLGVLYALMEHDLKRLLAYHSVENIGIILIGVGSGIVLASQGTEGPAAFAIAAGLFHTLNHALFKGLLFLSAGAVQRAAGTRDIEKLGGLIKLMPWTAGTFLIGAAAISAIPPLNGFASEWMTFQALLQMLGGSRDPLAAGAGACVVGALALTTGLAAFCFIKAFGVAFLGVGRSAPAAGATESPGAMLLGMGLLAAACTVLGLAPGLVVPQVTAIGVALLSGSPAAGDVATGPVTVDSGAYIPMAILAVVVVFGAVALAVVRALFGPGNARIAPPWVCGVALEPRMQYTAVALAKPVRLVFQGLLRPYRSVDRRHTQASYFVTEVHYEGGLHPVYETYLYRPVVALLLLLLFSRQVQRLQSGNLRLYLSYIFAILIVVLLLTPLMSGIETLLTGLQLPAVLLLAPVVNGGIKRWKAFWQNRRGHGIMQPWWDIAKYLARENAVSEHASWVYHWAPAVSLGATVAAACLVPTIAAVSPLGGIGEAVTLVGLLALARFALALAALDTASNFGGMGTSRELLFAALVEPSLFLGLFAVAAPLGTIDLGRIAAGAAVDVPHALAFACLFIVTIAETGRVPVDNPDTHLELTMAHEGMLLEYSGRPLGLLLLASHVKQLLLLSLLAALFFPWGMASEATLPALALGTAAYLLKVGALALELGLVESLYAKLRIFKVPELLGTAGVLGLLAVAAGATGRVSG